MPVYLVHGFRWPREGFTGIRVHAIVHNLEDCSVEYIQNENSQRDLLGSFRTLYPDIMKILDKQPGYGTGGQENDGLQFLEQYDPEDNFGPNVVSQPYAFVGDRVVMLAGGPNYQPRRTSEQPSTTSQTSKVAGSRPVSPEVTKKQKPPIMPMTIAPPITAPNVAGALSVNVEEVIADGPGMTPAAWEALADLRDKIAEGEKIGWWVVYNGDPERSYDEDEEDENEDEEDGEYEAEEDEEPEELPSIPQRSTQVISTRANQAQSPLTSKPLPPQPPTPSQARAANMAIREKPRSVLPPPQHENIPEPPKLKEIAKKEGLRKKFFGRKA